MPSLTLVGLPPSGVDGLIRDTNVSAAERYVLTVSAPGYERVTKLVVVPPSGRRGVLDVTLPPLARAS